jgi:ankyrin repeat protein
LLVFCLSIVEVHELHLAAYEGDVERVQELLEVGDDPNEYDERGYAPLLWAAFQGAVSDQLPVVLTLLAAGSVLMLAVQSRNEVLVRTLVERGAKINTSANEVTPLMVAARQSDRQIVRTLVELGADPARCAGR